MKLILFLLLTLKSLYAQVDIPAHSEAFILESNKEEILFIILNGQFKGRTFVMSSDFDKVKFFGRSPVDALAMPIKDREKAFYLHSSFNITVDEYRDELEQKHQERMDKYLFKSLEDYIPVSNRDVVNRASDTNLSCPEIPKRKNGESCHQRNAYELSRKLKELIRDAAFKIGEDAALVASIIHHESLYDLFIVNEHERKICHKQGKKCSPYRWGEGLAQLGASDAHFYGLDWHTKIERPKACKNKTILDNGCLDTMLKLCRKYESRELKPIHCPKAAIEAVALKLKSMIPEETHVWLTDSNQVKAFNLSTILKRDRVEEVRNKVGFYNRGIKVTNSFVEYFESYGSFPEYYGQAWSLPRLKTAPSFSIGHQMLTKEYINRCYVWSVAGLCGDIPKNSLYQLYFNQL